jgi:ubiquinone/menaquinone biosynthesis C-methylase UbiE
MPGSKSRDQIAEAYRSAPWWYDLRGFLILTFAYNSSLPRQVRFFGRNLGPRHIEIACGTGTLLDLILRWRRWKALAHVQVVGVDYAESMLGGAKRRFAKRADVLLEQADAAALPFPAGSFDTANIANAVHCLPDLEGALNDVFRVLRQGGTLAANVLLFPRGPWPLRQVAERINHWGIGKGILVTPYAQDDVRHRFVAAGFDIVSEAVSGNCYELLARKPGQKHATGGPSRGTLRGSGQVVNKEENV